MWEGTGAGAWFVVLVIIRLLLILLLCMPISLGSQGPILEKVRTLVGHCLPNWFMWSEYCV